MLRATEQLTWTAKLDRFKRGCDDSRAGEGPSPGRQQSEQATWQNFSGSHLTCKVIFTKPIDKPWPPCHTPSQTNGIAAASKISLDRQLRIIVECEEDQTFSSGSISSLGTGPQSVGKSALQPSASLVLLDVDLVRINKAYFHTEQRLKAVIVCRQNKSVLIRLLDELEPLLARRVQLEFCKEEDVQSFLSLIEPDSTLLNADRKAAPKKEQRKSNGNFSSSTTAEAGGNIAEPCKTEAGKKAAALEDAQPESQSQSLAEKLLQLNQTRSVDSHAPLQQPNSFSQPSPSQQLSGSAPILICSNCAHPARLESSATNTPISNSSSDNLVGVQQGQMSTPVTEWTYEDETYGWQEEQELNDRQSGWPDPSAVECIQDDVRRLCLTDPTLDWVIASCVDEHLQEIENQVVDYQ